MRVLQRETDSGPHPRVDSAILIPRLVYGQQRVLGAFVDSGFGTVAAPIYYGGVVRQLTLGSQPEDLGLVLDPVTHIRELPQHERAKSFRTLAYGDDPDPYVPEVARPSDNELEELARGPYRPTAARGGDVDAHHVPRGRGPWDARP